MLPPVSTVEILEDAIPEFREIRKLAERLPEGHSATVFRQALEKLSAGCITVFMAVHRLCAAVQDLDLQFKYISFVGECLQRERGLRLSLPSPGRLDRKGEFPKVRNELEPELQALLTAADSLPAETYRPLKPLLAQVRTKLDSLRGEKELRLQRFAAMTEHVEAAKKEIARSGSRTESLEFL